jgi:hypothetical protein
MKFKAATGRDLTAENLRFLAEKAFRYHLQMFYVNDCALKSINFQHLWYFLECFAHAAFKEIK